MELLSIPKELKEEFVLIKATNGDASVSELILASNRDGVSCTFNDYVVLTYPEGNKALPFKVYQVVGLFNEDTDFILRNLLNDTVKDYLENLNAKYFGQVVKCNVTNPDNPKGSNSGGNTSTSNPNGEGKEESSPSTSNGGSNSGSNSSRPSGSSKGKKPNITIIVQKTNDNNNGSSGNNQGNDNGQEDNNSNVHNGNEPENYNPNDFGNNENLSDDKKHTVFEGKHVKFQF